MNRKCPWRDIRLQGHFYYRKTTGRALGVRFLPGVCFSNQERAMYKIRSAIEPDQGTDIAPEWLFSEVSTRIVFCESLKRVDPKSHDRLRGHLQAAKKELFRLIRKNRRASLSKIVQRLRLDPDGPLPNGLVEKFGQKCSSLIKNERRKREITGRCI